MMLLALLAIAAPADCPSGPGPLEAPSTRPGRPGVLVTIEWLADHLKDPD